MAPKRKPAAGKSGAKPNKKPKPPSSSEDEIDDVEDEKPTKPANKRSRSGAGAQTVASMSSLHSINFDLNAKSPSGKPWNFKIASWNVNGLRSWLQKDGLEYVKRENPDIFCVNETKSSKEKIPPSAASSDYTNYWLSGDTEGYSGVGIYTKIKPLHVSYGIGMDEHDKEGRVITAEYEKFHLVAAYVPNSGRKLVRHDYRQKWDVDFRNYLKNLDKKKPVILCGDLNVAHEEIDIANPKNNKRNAGFTKEERDAFTELLESGFVDSFRHFHPDEKGAYTFWTYMMNARAKNVGWRLDYFAISKTLLPNLCESVIRKDVLGSDHCPIVLFMAF